MSRRPPPRKPPGDEPPEPADTPKKKPPAKRRPPAKPKRPDNPWERQPDEGDAAWEAFRTYRDMGATRSTAKVAQQLSKSKQLMDRWSGAHAWVVRARGYDGHVDREWLLEQRDLRRRAAKRNSSAAALAMQKFGQWVVALDIDDKRLQPGDMVRLAQAAVAIERVALGMDVPTSSLPGQGSHVDPEAIAGMSDEDRRARLTMLLREAQSRLDDSEPEDLDDDEREAS